MHTLVLDESFFAKTLAWIVRKRIVSSLANNLLSTLLNTIEAEFTCPKLILYQNISKNAICARSSLEACWSSPMRYNGSERRISQSW